MKNKYIDLIEQTFDFPQEEFHVVDNELYFNNIPLMDIIKQYGTPLKISYLPKISHQIQKAKKMFNVAIAKADYNGEYHYCYCTKSSHFSFVIEEVLKTMCISKHHRLLIFRLSNNFMNQVCLQRIILLYVMALNVRNILKIYAIWLTMGLPMSFQYSIISLNWINTTT